MQKQNTGEIISQEPVNGELIVGLDLIFNKQEVFVMKRRVVSRMKEVMIVGCLLCMVSACAAYTKGGHTRDRAPEVAIGEVKNYSEYPYGEEILASMLKSVLLDKKKNIVPMERASMYVEADLNEFKYKEGVAGEGAASVTVRLYKRGSLTKSVTSSKSGFGRESVSQILHKCLRKAVSKLNIK
jgi:hypothetical protein